MAARRRKDRRNQWWVFFRYRGHRIQERSPVQTKWGAQQYERTRRQELAQADEAGHDPFQGPAPTFVEFSARWMREYALARNQPSTIRSKSGHLRVHLVPLLGHLQIDKITTEHVDELISRMRAHGSHPKTVVNALSVLRTCLDNARRWRLIRSLPEFRWLRVPEPPIKFLSESEERALVDACDPGFWQTLVVFLLHTGLRFSEAAALNWHDIELDRPTPVVHVTKGGTAGKIGPTKTGSHRDVPLDPVVRALIERLPRTSDLVFPCPSGIPMSAASKVRYLYRFCDRAGIRRYGWHALRHTYGSRLAAASVPVPVISRLLGHTTVKMTMRYVHIDPATTNATAAVTARVMAAPTTAIGSPVTSEGQPRPEALS